MKRITLLTDFGIEDAYVASMKGVILSLAPHVPVIDITHSLHPHAISQGAFLLWSVYRYFPPGTIFVAVVDPGVGSSRRILCGRTDQYTFLAPDNGVLKFVLSCEPGIQIHEVTNHKYFLPQPSQTFHGRDIFAPVAAYIANGGSISRLGRKTKPDFGSEHFISPGHGRKGKSFEASVLSIDHFGNIVTNILFPAMISEWKIRFGSRLIRKSYPTYDNAKKGELFMLQGSSGLLEISMRQESAAAHLHARINQPLRMFR